VLLTVEEIGVEKNNESGNDDEVGIEHEIVWMEMERWVGVLRQRCKLPFWCAGL